MKTLIASVVFLVACNPATASGPYVEYTHDFQMQGRYKDKIVHHGRVGYQFENTAGTKFYGEAGYITGGEAAELGYTIEVTEKLSVKGYWEGIRTKGLSHKLETAIRYNF